MACLCAVQGRAGEGQQGVLEGVVKVVCGCGRVCVNACELSSLADLKIACFYEVNRASR